jgi:hypothetical protein
VQNRSLDELPENADDLDRLARRLDFEPTENQSAGQLFLSELDCRLTATREVFLRLTEKEKEA